jgi:hypothetical protein
MHMPFKRQGLVILLIVVMTTFAGNACAALLGVQPGMPQVSFNTGSTAPVTSYDPATGLFTVSASPLSYRWSTLLPPVTVTGLKSLVIRAHIDASGKLLPNVDGDGIVVTGTVAAAGQSYSGTLLTGTATGFGFFNSSTTTDSFDFRFTTTGGSLQPLYAGSDIGVTLASENSSFNGDFATAFQGNAKGTVGAIPGPYLTLTESCTDAVGEIPIQVTATLANVGREPLTAVTCSQDPAASLTGVPGNLAVGDSATMTGSYSATRTPSTGTITCSATGSNSLVTVSMTSSATCAIIATPGLKIAERCTDATAPGQAIPVSAVLTNSGNERLSGVSCSDSNGATVSGVPATLDPGETVSVTASYVPAQSGSADSITCSAIGALDGASVSATSGATCNITTKPSLGLAQSCVNAPAPGQPIALSAVLANTGNEPLTGISCSDGKGTLFAGVPTTLAPGGSASFTGSYVPRASGSTDTITCSASGAINGAAVSANASATCNIVTAPALSLSESCADAPAPGQPITLSALLANTGNEPLSGISCSDSRGAAITGVPVTLAPGATATLKGGYVPTASGSTSSITCSASGTVNGGTVSAISSSTCNIVTNPQLAVAETCGNAAAPGQPITLSAVLANTGNEPLTAIVCSDSKGAVLSGVPRTLNPGASVTVTGSYTPASSPSTDAITCSASGAINGASAGANSSATCSILNPAISIRKLTNGIDAPTGTGPTLPFGSAVTWTYIVTNSGNVALTDVAVTDNRVPAIFCPQSALAVGATMTCTATGTAISGQYLNIGTATGRSGGVTVTSSYLSHYVGSTTVGCTYTQGYWKTHPEKWQVSGLVIGSIRYSEAQLLTVLDAPVKGNGLISLAHQLIAAKLNAAGGGALTPEVQGAINSADAVIGSLVLPPVGTGDLSPEATATIEGTLDGYNNGQAANGPGHC